MIFPEMMAEMRRPMDFYKGMAVAQMLIFVVYLVYGIFCKYLMTNMHFPLN
jgi:type III secretory pathway component EscV